MYDSEQIYFTFFLVLATSGLEKIPIKKRSDVKKGMLRAIDKNFPDSKIHSLDTNQEVQILLRLVRYSNISGFPEVRSIVFT